MALIWRIELAAKLVDSVAFNLEFKKILHSESLKKALLRCEGSVESIFNSTPAAKKTHPFAHV